MRFILTKSLFLKKLREHFPELVIYDFDNESDRLIINYAMDLLDKAEKAIIVIEANEGSAGSLIAFLEKIITYKNKCLVLLYGHNPLVERMLMLLDKDRLIQADLNTNFIQKVINFLSAELS